jgi:hypothetical protein
MKFSKFIYKNTHTDDNVKEWDATYFENLFIWGELDDWTNASNQMKTFKLSNEYKKQIQFAIKTTEQQGLVVPYLFKLLAEK